MTEVHLALWHRTWPWLAAVLLGTVLYLACLFLIPVSKDLQSVLALGSLGLSAFLVALLRPERVWRWGLAVPLAVVISSLVTDDAAGSLTGLVILPVLLIISMPGAYLGRWVAVRSDPSRRAAEGQGARIRSAVIMGALSLLLSYLLLQIYPESYLTGLPVVILTLGLLTAAACALRPSKTLPLAAGAASGLPLLVILQIVSDTASGRMEHDLFPIEILLAVGVSLTAVAAGAGAGRLITRWSGRGRDQV